MRPRARWLTSPFVLARYPGLLLAIAGAGVILAAAAAAAPPIARAPKPHL